MTATEDYLYFPASATIEQVLRTYIDRQAQWWWLLVTEIEGAYYVCSFGSLLPYLTGRTPHIVHSIGDCPICSGMDPVFWSNTDALVAEALADADTLSRSVSDLPMAELPVIEANDTDGSPPEYWAMKHGSRAWGVTERGILREVHILQVKGDLGGLPDF